MHRSRLQSSEGSTTDYANEALPSETLTSFLCATKVASYLQN